MPHVARRAVGASATGAILALGFPPSPAGAITWLAFAPALLALAPPPGRAAGLGVGLVGVSWLVPTATRFAGLGPLAAGAVWLAFGLYVALPFALWGAVVGLGPRGPLARALFAASAFAAIEHFFPTPFHYQSAVGLAGTPAWIQGAEIGGAPLVVWLVVFTGALLAEAIARLSRLGPRRAAPWLLAAAIVPAASYGLGRARMAQVDREARSAPVLRVGVVQPNVPIRWSDPQAHLTALRDGSRRVARAGADLVVWPESSYPWAIHLPFERDFPPGQAPIRGLPPDTVELPFVFATTSYRDGSPWPSNRAFLLDRRGRVRAQFAKVHLIPFGERVPLLDPTWAVDHLPGVEHYEAGTAPARFPIPRASDEPTADVALGPMICYEDNLPDFAREVAASPGGVHGFLNLTNDTWFGASAEPWQHQGLAVFRAVEHRIPMIRALNTGPSALVHASGRVTPLAPLRADSPAPRADAAVAELPLARNTARRPTPYARWGWTLPAWLALATLAGLVLGRHGARASHDGARPPAGAEDGPPQSA